MNNIYDSLSYAKLADYILNSIIITFQSKWDLAFHVNRMTFHMKCQALFYLENNAKKSHFSLKQKAK